MYDENGDYVGAEGPPEVGGYRGLLGAVQDSTGRIISDREAAEIELAGRVNQAATDVEDANIQAQQQQQAIDLEAARQRVAAANRQRYLDSLDDESRRAMRNMSAAQIEREIYGRDAEAQAAAEAGLGETNIEINRQGGWDSEVG